MEYLTEETTLDAGRARELAAAHKALGEETRLQMLVILLAVEELCVCRFEGLLGITQSKASRHLRYLSNAGLLADRREGVWVHYRVAPDLSPALREVVEGVRRSVGDEILGEIRRTVQERAGLEAEDGLLEDGAPSCGCDSGESEEA